MRQHLEVRPEVGRRDVLAHLVPEAAVVPLRFVDIAVQ